ncbi:MAG: TatD family hydrolase [Bacteroidales bacterium]|nr:TatD family hydrolase [Bacteroidales bacterium]
MMIDTHCHFDIMPKPEAYIRQKEQAGDIVIGMTNLPSHFKLGIPFIRNYKHIRLALGLHPLLAADNIRETNLFREYINQTSYIGEIGLDFSKACIGTKDVQISVLKELLAALQGKNKIVSVHSRKAEKVLLALLCEYDIKNVIFHWYSGPTALIPEILSKGYYFSINESMTLSNNGRSIIDMIPRNRILTESDAPYNEKSDIKKAMANIQITEAEIFRNFSELLSRVR